MDSFLTIVGKVVPVAYSLLSLWIKAFNDAQRVTESGKFMLVGLAASAMLFFFADKLDNKLSEISDRVKSAALYEKISEANTVKPGDIKLTLSASSKSNKARRHPKYLFKGWKVSLHTENDRKGLLGTEIYGSADPEEDTEEEMVFVESRTFSNFNGDFASLVNPENWNDAELQIKIGGRPEFFPETLDEWILPKEDERFVSDSKKEHEEGCPEPDRKATWRMLPMRIHAQLDVQGKPVAKSEGYLVFSCTEDQKKPRVIVKMPPFSIPEGAFLSKANFVKPVTEGDRQRCSQFRILGWIFSFVAVVAGGAAARMQWQSL
jgi:hypothetical protein